MQKRYDLILLDFDGTIFDSEEAIYSTMQKTYHHFHPTEPIPTTALRAQIAQGQAPEATFRALQPSAAAQATFNESLWISTYRALYATHGQPLTTPYPYTRTLLRALARTHHIPVAVISNKAVAAVTTALRREGLLRGDWEEEEGQIPEELVVGDGVFAVGGRKPHPSGFAEVLVPRLRAYFLACNRRGGEEGMRWLEGEVDMSRVLMVGDTVTDIRFARNIGSPVCWCRFGQGDPLECEALRPEFVIDDLREFESKVLRVDV
ncbi:HAD family hydrolase [Aspergillus homomorphus CBS 101889]|uniref:HAD-like protein n=1 Tax=Aspergillus homomorphus (strain CBS 101889) TaxID=1450537 RepID=A0A395IA93_ASPHC|nr:HAD-like protein [Aspergillus homomorphus CBS 101889]RAL16885.1 HAD-like protein [Aspergillus homomorphus CBS 101889]